MFISTGTIIFLIFVYLERKNISNGLDSLYEKLPELPTILQSSSKILVKAKNILKAITRHWLFRFLMFILLLGLFQAILSLV